MYWRNANKALSTTESREDGKTAADRRTDNKDGGSGNKERVLDEAAQIPPLIPPVLSASSLRSLA